MAIKRRKTITVRIGNIKIGSAWPIAIQSMTKVFTTDIKRAVKQINQLSQAGCSMVRVAVPTKADTVALAEIVQKVNVPIIADVHFNPDRAIEAIEAGAAKIRINPGNIKDKNKIIEIINKAKRHHTAVRVGINEASIRDLKGQDTPPPQRVKLMLNQMKKYIAIFEKQNFNQLVLSAKSADPIRTIEINRLIAKEFPYPIHLGLTHAGLAEDAQIPSAIAVGTLLAEGIGDTIRISVAGNPLAEVEIAKKILSCLGLYEQKGPELIVCPSCGRAQIDITRLAKIVKTVIKDCAKPLRIAVMGCVVNGPGEAKDADLAICAGKTKVALYWKGQKIKLVEADNIIPELLNELKSI